MNITIPEDICQSLSEGLKREWLETNGAGGYASSTILNCHTRRYHGLLVANLTEPPGRYLLLSTMDESLLAQDKEFFISCHKYPGAFHPHGHQFLREFRQDIHPHFTYQIGDACIHKSILLPQGENTVLVRYYADACSLPLALRLRPLLAFRNHHHLARANTDIQAGVTPVKYGFKIQPYRFLPPMFFQVDAHFRFYPAPAWYYNFEYPVEQERGFDFHEDLFSPGLIEIPIQQGDAVILSASLNDEQNRGLASLWDSEVARRGAAARKDSARARAFKTAEQRETVRRLVADGRRFCVRMPTGRPSVIAGYPWFEDYCRDMLISLPGLTFCSGRMDEGIDILSALGPFEKDGLLPNFFGAGDVGNAYNSVDASLWYFWAVQHMLRYGGPIGAVKESFWPVMKRILRAYMAGTRHGIGMDASGLLRAGNSATQLTWMDATMNGVPVTPRSGFAVEINALWYNAICFAAQLAAEFRDKEIDMAGLPRRIAESFNRTFWIPAESYLGDVVTAGVLDTSVRPNQILAVSLPFSPLAPSQWAGIVERVKEELLTPYGLRTLSPRSSRYIGRYEGEPAARDAAYHQGTVWPWLLGHFGEACLRAARDPIATGKWLVDTINPLVTDHMETAGLGSISEVFDGDPPHRPNGCFAQAWSTAELIRLFGMLKTIAAAPARTARGKARKPQSGA